MQRVVAEGMLQGTLVVCEKTPPAVELYNSSRFGALLRRQLKLSLYEALYLHEQGRLAVRNTRGPVTAEQLARAGRRAERGFAVKYAVFADLRSKGYIVKTALKYGADFRVYDKGVKPGEDHAKWVVYPVREAESLTWYSVSAKNRVAHSTRKKLLVAVVDDEHDVTYFQIQWERP